MKYTCKNRPFSQTGSLLFITLCILCFHSSAFAQRKYLFTWDKGSGTDMPGWTWATNVAYGHPGWILNTDGPFGGSINFSWGPSPRTFEKSDYGNDTSATIITTDHAPSTETGGALKIYDTGSSTKYQSCWWVWYDGEQLQKRGVTNADTDRWSFYIKTTGTTTATENTPGATFHVGTYLTDDTSCASYGTGDGAPYEGPGNQHYYHYLQLSPGAWLHVELDRHPTHRRGSHVAGNDPAFILPPTDKCTPAASHPMHYYANLSQWYMEIRDAQAQKTSYLLDDMYFYSTNDPTESAEPNQNDESVTSLWVGYWPGTGKWQMGWNDMSYTDATGTHTNDNTNSTFEIRWSTEPITNANYNNAHIVKPEWYSDPAYTSYPNGIRRWNAWSVIAYTQFDLPDGIEANNSKIYFAVKDVSINGGNAGTQWPWNKPDGHDAASPYIRTIDYSLQPNSNNTIVTPDILTITISD